MGEWKFGFPKCQCWDYGLGCFSFDRNRNQTKAHDAIDGGDVHSDSGLVDLDWDPFLCFLVKGCTCTDRTDFRD